VQNGNFEMAKLLLGYGAKVDARDNQKRTPLMMIDYDATPELLDLLLADGARFDLKDRRKNNVLHLAASNSVQNAVFERLLILGVDVNVVNKEGETPLMLAAENNSDSIVGMLLRAGARSDLVDKEKQSAWDRTNNPAVRAALTLYMQERPQEQ
jgi:ankyrin repeat protein